MTDYSSVGEEFADYILKHEYDPVKAREYYLRTRKLKGRQKAAQEQKSGRASIAAKPLVKKQMHQKPKTPAQKKAHAEESVAHLRARLEILKEVLAKLVKAAKERSGAEDTTTSDSSKKDTNSKSEKKQDLTAQQKREKAKQEKEYREAHQTTSEKKAALQKELADTQQKIETAREKLKILSQRQANRSRRGQGTANGR